MVEISIIASFQSALKSIDTLRDTFALFFNYLEIFPTFNVRP